LDLSYLCILRGPTLPIDTKRWILSYRIITLPYNYWRNMIYKNMVKDNIPYIAGHSTLDMIQISGSWPCTTTFITQIFIIIAYISKTYIIIRKLFTYNFWARFDPLNNKIDRKSNFFHIKKGGDTVHRGGTIRALIGSVRASFYENRYRTKLIGIGIDDYRNRSVITKNWTDLPIHYQSGF
jgi:hypothetical protein